MSGLQDMLSSRSPPGGEGLPSSHGYSVGVRLDTTYVAGEACVEGPNLSGTVGRAHTPVYG